MFAEDQEVRGLSTTAKYTIIAVVLGILTAIEVLVLYPPLILAPTVVKVATLGLLGTGKFILVVAFFMHLWNDHPIYTGIFATGMVIGVGTLVALLALMDVYPKPENAVKAPPLEEIFEQRRLKHSEGADYEEHSWAFPTLVEVSRPA